MTTIDPLIADLRRRREAAGMSQRQLAKACGTAQSHICAIERGLTTPGLEVLRRMGQVLGVAPSWEPLAYEADDDAVSRTLHVAEQTAAMAREGGGLSDAQALGDRRATGCQYELGLCACPGGSYRFAGCLAPRPDP